MLLWCRVVVALSLFYSAGAAGQSTLPPIYSRNENLAYPFAPLAPQFSDYSVGHEARGVIEGLLPGLGVNDALPAPITGSPHGFGLDGSGTLGTALAVDLRIWEGFYRDAGCNFSEPAEYGVFPGVLDETQGGDERVFALLREAGLPILDASPPALLGAIFGFSGTVPAWVDLFGPHLSRAFFDEGSWSETTVPESTPGYGQFGYPRVGSPQHLDIPATYPPLTLDIEASTSPLAPSGGRGPRRSQYTERQSVESTVDLVTGQPLLREVDLELPFGGAVFRKIRTYSERPEIGISSDYVLQGTFSAQTGIRGWHGMNWMSSEAPLFLIDAAMVGTVAVPGQEWQPVCYFSPDAHHTIPFVRQERLDEPPDYIAPTWFDAMLLYDKSSTVWEDGRWVVPPEEFKVYLHGRSVVYTIKAYYEDVDPAQHEPPTFDSTASEAFGFGTPYYGLVQRIEDRAGNRVEIVYADASLHAPYLDTEYAADGLHIHDVNDVGPEGVAANGVDPDNPPAPCNLIDDREAQSLVVRQNGWYKGMIDRVELVAAGESTPTWTLLYTYRHFFARSKVSDGLNYWNMRSNAPALHSVLVYDHKREGAPSLAGLLDGRRLILPCDDLDNPDGQASAVGLSVESQVPTFVEGLVTTTGGGEQYVSKQRLGTMPTPFDYQDEVIGPVGLENPQAALPEWDRLVRYTYADPQTYTSGETVPGGLGDETFQGHDWTLRSCGPLNPTQSYTSVSEDEYSRVGAWLLKTAVFSKLEPDEAGTAASSSPGRYWLYRYQDIRGPDDDMPDATEYSGVYGTADIWQYGVVSPSLPRRLTHRYGPETINRLLAHRTADTAACDDNRFVNLLITLEEEEGIPSDLCLPSEPTEPPHQPDPPIEPGDPQFGDSNHVPFGEPPGEGRSSTASNDAGDQEGIAIGLLADMIFYRWSEQYRMGSAVTHGPTVRAIPASWECFDGRGVEGHTGDQSVFALDLWQGYIGGQLTTSCGELNGRITHLAQERSGFLPVGTGLFSISGPSGAKWYRLYRFVTTPPVPDEGQGPGWRGSLGEGGGSVSMNGPEVIWDNNNANYDDPDSPIYHLNSSPATRALYLYPFRFVAHDWAGNLVEAVPQQLELIEPMWWTAVDEYDSLEDALADNSSLAYTPTHAFSDGPAFGEFYNASNSDPWINRRVVGMNCAGAILSDRTWSRDQGEGGPQTNDPPAVLEAYVYDDYLRLEQKFSRGWGAAVAETWGGSGAGSEASNGLVEVFEYGDVVMLGGVVEHVPREVIYHTIRKGCLGAEHQPIREVSRHDDTGGAWWDGLPEFETYYGLGVEGAAVPIGMIEHHYGFHAPVVPDDGTEPADPVMKFRIRLGPVFKNRPDGMDVRPIDGQWYNEKGQLVWRAQGAIAPPGAGELESGHLVVNQPGAGSDDQVFLDYFHYDEHGRRILSVEDISIAPSASSGLGFVAGNLAHPEYPVNDPTDPVDHNQITDRTGVLFVGSTEGADDVTASEVSDILLEIESARTNLIGSGVHRAAEAGALNEITFTAYNRFGPYKTVHPDGRRDLTTYEVGSDFFRELRAMGVSLEDGEWTFAGAGLYDSDFEGSTFVAGIQGTIDDLIADQWSGAPYEMDSALFNDNRLEVVAHIEPSYDTAGRLTGVAIADEAQSPDALESVVAYNGWNSILLSITPDGLITRHTYDGLGRLHKTFVGSRDRHFIWGTADEGDEDDDLFMTEKLFYGSSPTDAGLPEQKWTYRTKSAEQYGEQTDWSEPSEGTPGGHDGGEGTPLDTDTSTGRLEKYGYDWRMRRVATRYEDLDEPGVVLREERIFLDNMDRVRFTAVYDGAAPADPPDPLDPPGAPTQEGDAIGVGMALPEASNFLTASASVGLVSLDETVYNEAGQVVERRRWYDPPDDPAASPPTVIPPGFLVTHSYSDYAGRPVWSSSSGGRFTEQVYDAKGRLVGTRDVVTVADAANPGATVERVLGETSSVYGTDGTVIETRAAVFDAESPTPTVAVHTSLQYFWYDSAQRRVATMDLGRLTAAELSAVPGRADDPPLVFEEISAAEKRLVGVEYPTDAGLFDASGRGLARLSASWHDRLGKPSASLRVTEATRDASGVVSIGFTLDTTEHNNFGQPVLDLERAFTATSADWSAPVAVAGTGAGGTGWDGFLRGRALRYEGTRVVEVAAVLPGHALVVNQPGGVEGRSWLEADWAALPPTPPTAPTLLRTLLVYDAPVVEAGDVVVTHSQSSGGGGGISDPIVVTLDSYRAAAVSVRPDLVFAVVRPDPVTGVPDLQQGHPDVVSFYWYYADGSVALREDSNGVVTRHHYDADGNLVRLQGDDANLPIVGLAGMTEAGLPSNALEYGYDGVGRLVSVAAGRDLLSGVFDVRASSVLGYDFAGNLVGEAQWRAGGLATRTVSYGWETLLRDAGDPVSFDNNVNRLSSILYPDRVGTHDSGSWARRSVDLHYGEPGSLDDALSRVSGLTSAGGPGPAGAAIGHVASYRYDADGRLAGVDLGRVPGVTGDPFTQTDDRTFDRFGRVVTRTVDSYDAPASTSGPVYQTILDASFTYDLAGRRTSERLRLLDLVNPGDRDDAYSGLFGYDGLGRLASEVYGDLDDADPLGPLTAWNRDVSYALDPLNRRVKDGSGGDHAWVERVDSDGDGAANTTTGVSHTVDTRGRLTAIETNSTTEAVDHDASGGVTELDGRRVYYDWLGRPVYVADAATGEPVVAWSYDGFGRLAKKVAPWPALVGGQPVQREEYYYYDGVRRIQEVFHDPTAATPPWPQAPGGGGSGVDEWRTEAEHIWSAASGDPIDTLHVHVDWWDREAWMVQDHATGTPKSYTDPSGEVAEQYGFDSFGRVVRRDQFPLVKSGSQGYYRSFRQRLGHQGLFVERMDSDTTKRVLHPGYDIWAQSRSRWYVPELGRFLTPDPNGTGVPVMSTLAMLGMVPTGPPSGSFAWDAHFGDGRDVFGGYGGDPVNATDPTGLFFYVDVLSGALIRGGLRAYGVYDAAETARGFIQDLQSGISMQQAMLALAAEMVFDRLGGKLFEKAIDGFQRVTRSFRRGNGVGAPNLPGRYRGVAEFPDVGKILPYKEAQKLTAGKRGDIQAHHILEKRFAEKLGITDTDRLPAIILTREQHQEITNRLRAKIAYGDGTKTATPAMIRAMYMEVYEDYPDMLTAISGLLR